MISVSPWLSVKQTNGKISSVHGLYLACKSENMQVAGGPGLKVREDELQLRPSLIPDKRYLILEL